MYALCSYLRGHPGRIWENTRWTLQQMMAKSSFDSREQRRVSWMRRNALKLRVQ